MITVAIAFVLAAGSPAASAPAGNVPATAVAAATRAAQRPEPQIDRKLYCFEESFTGSRLRTKLCKTRAEWAAEGIDVSNPPR